MPSITDGEWIADVGEKTCRNINTKVIVEMNKMDKMYIGKLKYVPFELLSQYVKLKHGEKPLIKAIMEAEEVFLRALAESRVERKN